MSNLAGKAYALNVLTPMVRWHAFVKKIIFVTVRAFPHLLDGVQGLSFIHFARWAVIRRAEWPGMSEGRKSRLTYNYMLFCSNFNGTWEQYVDAFSDGIPDILNLAWFGDYRYPKSIPTSPFQDYIEHNQFDTDYYYNATPGANQRDIKASIRVLIAVRELQALHASNDPARFAAAFRGQLVSVQNCLGSMGFAPVASVASQKAAQERQNEIDKIWKDATS